MKLFVTDLDGTLLDEGRQVLPRDKQALREAAAMGLEICLASGRMDEELVKVMREVGIDCHRISQNGAFVTTKEDKLLQSSSFDPSLAKQLLEVASAYEFVTLIGVGQTVYLQRKTEASELIQQRMFAPFIVEPQIAGRLEEHVPCKLSFFGDITKLKQMQQVMESRFGGQMETFVSDKDCLDVMPFGTSKGSAVQALIKELGIEAQEVACIGDAFNDISMLRVTPHSFAMGHGPDEVRQSARHVVDSVAEAIEQLKQVRV